MSAFRYLWIASMMMGFLVSPAVQADSFNFNQGWRFALGEQDQSVQTANFDDSSWQEVDFPHDWAIAGPFDPQENGYAGKLPWRGVGWYRKVFSLSKDEAGHRVYLDFDGVMAFPKVYVNGQLAGEWDYGYMSFRVDATPFVKFGESNLVVVQADTRQHGTRWYPGAGIYRKVTLTLCDPVHLAHWGTFISTPSVTDDLTKIQVSTIVENQSGTDADPFCEFRLIDPQGNSRLLICMKASIPAGATKEIVVKDEIHKPQLWDIVNPNLYSIQIVIRREDGNILDSENTPFGIRTFEFTANDGFHLNGRRMQLHGVCLHHDQGPLGGAFFTRAMERQLEIMRDMGCNAIRTSHNPPSPELLDLCDRMGFVVWDECFDKWDATADHVNGEPLEAYGEKQIRQLTLRDRNHPCVVVWSIGNEIGSGPRTREGNTPVKTQFMSDFFRKYDSTRPVGMACHIPGQVTQGMFDALDLTGWNYSRRYAQMKEQNPNKPLIYSESASALSTRGFFDLPLPQEKTQYSKSFQVDSYDHNAAQWSDIPDKEFQLMENDRFMAGEFVWTGFDYLGEPTPFSREARSSYFGIVDLCGIPKDRYYLYRSYWRPDTLTVHILPHWNWPDRIGQHVPVYVYTNGDSAELFLNGQSMGIRTKKIDITDATGYYAVVDRYRLRWMDTVYQPGELNAVAYKDGQKIGEAVMRTAGDPVAIRLTPDRSPLKASGEDLAYILVEALDKDGNLCPLADNLIHFELTGPARIAGVGNGNPMSIEPFQADYRKLFYGKAMLILRTENGKKGTIGVRAWSDGLQDGDVNFFVND